MSERGFIKNDNTHLSVLYDLARAHKFPHAVILQCLDEKFCEEIALEIAEILLCTENIKPCGKCSNCVKMKSGFHPDVNVIASQGAGKSIKVEDIRFIRDDAHVVSNEGGYKLYIIKNSQLMTLQAQNAFIKILEEPPEKVIFMLLCESDVGLLDTVKSRSQIFRFDRDLNSTEKPLYIELAEKLALAASEKDIYRVMEYTAKIPNDRKLFKNVLESLISQILTMYSCGDFDKVDMKSFVMNIEEIRDLLKLVDKNVNFNLLVCYLCACLQF